MELTTSLDNLIFYIDKVMPATFETFTAFLSEQEMQGNFTKINQWFGTSIKDYHHNLKIGDGAGAIMIGYKHNKEQEKQGTYRMRLELNPAKRNEEHERFSKILTVLFKGHPKLIKGLDIAFDLPVPIGALIPISLTGKYKGTYDDTIYFGKSGKNGRLKIYDKKKEMLHKQGKEVEQLHLTRVEYSLRIEDPITVQLLKTAVIQFNKEYQISLLNMDKLEGLVKACVIAVSDGKMQIKELTRTYQNKVKKALASMETLDLDHAYTSARNDILNIINDYTRVK